MAKDIDGVSFKRDGDHAICHVECLSDDLKALIRANLASICHGSRVTGDGIAPLYSYQSTLKSFIDRYDTKAAMTQIGMIGEFLSHVLIANLFDEFEVASPFFNLEEKAIKKGFDILLYRAGDKSSWISEVKSGGLHKGKSHDETTRDLLNTARDDLVGRLNEQEAMYWFNAVNSVRAALADDKDYRSILVKILEEEGSFAAQNKATSADNCVVLVSSLFEPLTTKISSEPATKFMSGIKKKKVFAQTLVFCIQKATYSAVVEFLRAEIA